MAWRIVRQPDGLLARWSDIVDDFTHVDMTQAEAEQVCCDHGLSASAAAEKVRAGIEDWEPWTVGRRGDGLSRWRDCMEVIHGRTK